MTDKPENPPAFPPRPGSEAARANGCKCPVIDNHYGAGYGGDGEKYGWIVTSDCFLHTQPVLIKRTKPNG